MPFTPLPGREIHEPITKAIWDILVEDLAVLRFAPYVALRSATTVAPDMTETAVDFATEVTDNDGMHSGGDTNRITIQTAGVYRLFGHCLFEASSAGDQRVVLLRDGAGAQIWGWPLAPLPAPTNVQIDYTSEFGVGDAIDAFVWQDSGGDLDIIEGSYFGAVYLGTP